MATARYTFLRLAELAREGCPLRGQVEVDESYLGPTRDRGQKDRANPRKVPVFGVLEPGGRVHCRIVRNLSRTTLQAIIEGHVA